MDYKSIGRNIQNCRNALGFTQEQFAEIVGLSVSYIGAIERGEKLPRLTVFIHIADTLKVSTDSLLSGVLAQGNETIASDLSKQISQLPPIEQRRILNVIQTMLADAK